MATDLLVIGITASLVAFVTLWISVWGPELDRAITEAIEAPNWINQMSEYEMRLLWWRQAMQQFMIEVGEAFKPVWEKVMTAARDAMRAIQQAFPDGIPTECAHGIPFNDDCPLCEAEEDVSWPTT